MHTRVRLLAALVVVGFPALAVAHPGHAHSVAPHAVSGLAHSLFGADLWLAALALPAGIAALAAARRIARATSAR